MKNQKYIQHTNRTFNSRKQDICTNNKLTKVKHTKNKYQTDIQHMKNRHIKIRKEYYIYNTNQKTLQQILTGKTYKVKKANQTVNHTANQGV